jgi:hypothetical protein
MVEEGEIMSQVEGDRSMMLLGVVDDEVEVGRGPIPETLQRHVEICEVHVPEDSRRVDAVGRWHVLCSWKMT